MLVLLLLGFYAPAQNKYILCIRGVDQDSARIVSQTGIQTSFPSRFVCTDYINKLPGLLQSAGYVTASIDSLSYDSTFARIVLFIGDLYRWALLDVTTIEPGILSAIGWRDKMFAGKPIDFSQVRLWEDRILNHLENNGHPFARVFLDSLLLDGESVSALLKVTKGPLYKIDSIRVYGNAKISNNYLQRYLDIANNSTYNKEKLLRINKKTALCGRRETGRPYAPRKRFRIEYVPEAKEKQPGECDHWFLTQQQPAGIKKITGNGGGQP